MAPARTPARPLPLRRQPNQARSRDKVARALAAADDLLDEAGPDALTLNRVAERAGLTAGALHQYLPDRDAIVEVLAARYLGGAFSNIGIFAILVLVLLIRPAGLFVRSRERAV